MKDWNSAIRAAADVATSWGDQCAGGSGREIIPSGPSKGQMYGQAYYNLAASILKLAQIDAVAVNDNVDTCLVCGKGIPPGPDFCSMNCEVSFNRSQKFERIAGKALKDWATRIMANTGQTRAQARELILKRIASFEPPKPDAQHLLMNLLAVIHRDGGHYVAEPAS